MGMFSKEKPVPAGHLRVHASLLGDVTGVEVLAPLEPAEVEPALQQAFMALEQRRAASSQKRLDEHLRAVRKKAGMMDRLRGRVTHREEAAHDVVPAEIFEGNAGPVHVSVDGRFGFVRLRVDGGTSAREAGGFLPRALEEACKACEGRWEEVVLGADDDEKSAEGPEPKA